MKTISFSVSSNIKLPSSPVSKMLRAELSRAINDNSQGLNSVETIRFEG